MIPPDETDGVSHANIRFDQREVIFIGMKKILRFTEELIIPVKPAFQVVGSEIQIQVHDTTVDSYYLNKNEPNKSCLLALRSIILERDPNITETKKYGMPCFCYKKKMFCYLWTDKKTDEPYILMVEGKYLDHPYLEVGKRSRMKIFRIDPNKDLPLRKIKLLLNEALDLYRNGTIKVKLK